MTETHRDSEIVEAARRALLTGEAPQPWVDALSSAAGDGDADAANTLATLYASGAWVERDWAAAFRWLDHAAALGSASASGQLKLLGQGRPVASDASVCAGDWLGPAAARTPVLEQPRVRLAEGFIPSPVCEWLCGLARGRLTRAKMVEGYGIEPSYTEARTNSDFILTVFDADCVLAAVRERISAFLKLPVPQMEPPQILHYTPGQELRPHVDYLQRGPRLPGQYQGDRIATFLIYLNDAFGAGETWFVRPDVKVRGATGDAIYFANVLPSGDADPASLHAGLPPSWGEKFLFSQWIHDRPFADIHQG